jgi:hypothetical protein
MHWLVAGRQVSPTNGERSRPGEGREIRYTYRWFGGDDVSPRLACSN